MKHLKIFGLMVTAASLLMAVAWAGGASATELTCTNPPGTKVMCPTGTELHLEAESTVTMHPPIGDIACTGSTLTGLAGTGSATTTPVVAIEAFTLTGCGASVSVLQKGSLEIHTTETNANHDGTVTWTGLELTTEFSGFHCIFKTNGTDIGDLTGSTTTGSTPTLDIKATIPRTGGRSGAFCGSTAQWTGFYKFKSPTWLDVD